MSHMLKKLFLSMVLILFVLNLILKILGKILLYYLKIFVIVFSTSVNQKL